MDDAKFKLILRVLLFAWCLVVPVGAILVAVYLVVDYSIETDHLKSHMSLQRRDMDFLLALVAQGDSSCKLPLSELQVVAKQTNVGIDIRPGTQLVRVGSFVADYSNNCVTKLRLDAYR